MMMLRRILAGLCLALLLAVPATGQSGRKIVLLSGKTRVNPLFHRSFVTIESPGFTFPSRARPNEPQRTQLIIQNLGAVALQFGYRPGATNSNYNGATTWSITLNPGQEYRENGSSTGMIFGRTSLNGQTGKYTVYAELNGAVGSGVATTESIQPLPYALPVLNVASYTTATAYPCGLSKDQKTIYGTAGTTTLYQSTNDGASWSSVGTFAANVAGLVETDDGEAIIVLTGGSAVPGFLYKSSGWSVSHTGATWSLVLTSASGAFFRNFWDGGAYSSFGRDSINSTGKYGVITEYGSALNSGTGTTFPTHVYFTSNYGTTWAQVLDLAVTYPSLYPLHSHAAAYDLYWDRLWLTFGETTFNGVNNITPIYSDDHGSTWNTVPLPTEWQNQSSVWQSNQIMPLTNSVIFGSDHTDGYYRFPRTGYRQLGAGQMSAVVSTHTGSQQTNNAGFRVSPSQRLFASLQPQSTSGVAASIFADAVDDGATMAELWRDDTTLTSGNGNVADVYGPTANGYVVANAANGAGTQVLLRGTIVAGVPGQYAQYASVTGDGSTTAFTFPHFLSSTPTTLLAYPQNAPAIAATPTLTADGTNITLTFSVAPTNTTVYEYALRYK